MSRSRIVRPAFTAAVLLAGLLLGLFVSAWTPLVLAQSQSESAGRSVGAATVPEPPVLKLSLEGILPADLELEADAQLGDVARALAALAAVPLPPGAGLPVAPDLATARWSAETRVPVDLFTELEAAPGHVLRVLTVELENFDDRAHALPHAATDDPFAAFEDAEDLLSLRVVGLDARGRRYPTAAVLCGGDILLLPGGRLPCRMVWQLPAAVELAAVELDLPARLHIVLDDGEG